MEKPCLGVQPRSSFVVAHPNISSKLGERLQRLDIGRSHVGRGEQTKRTSGAETSERLTELHEPTPLHEAHQQVDSIGGGELPSDLRTDSQIARTIYDELTVPEWNTRALQLTFTEPDLGSCH